MSNNSEKCNLNFPKKVQLPLTVQRESRIGKILGISLKVSKLNKSELFQIKSEFKFQGNYKKISIYQNSLERTKELFAIIFFVIIKVPLHVCCLVVHWKQLLK